MHKILQDALQERIVGYMAEHHPQFQHRKSMPKYAGKSILFQQKYKSGFIKFIQVKYEQGRDYVFLNMQWSKLNRFPDELSVEPTVVSKAKTDLTLLDNYDETWLSLYELGEVGEFRLPIDAPDEIFAKKFYTPERHKTLDELDFDIEAEPSYDRFFEEIITFDWENMILCFGKDLLDQEDIDRILGDMPDRICHMITTKVIPYFEALEARLGITE